MNFIQSKFYDHWYRPGPAARHCVATIGLSLSILAMAHPLLAKPAAVSASPNKVTQRIALQPTNAPRRVTIANTSQDFRLLGYGLFLLQIGLIPLKLAKGNSVQTIAPD